MQRKDLETGKRYLVSSRNGWDGRYPGYIFQAEVLSLEPPYPGARSVLVRKRRWRGGDDFEAWTTGRTITDGGRTWERRASVGDWSEDE